MEGFQLKAKQKLPKDPAARAPTEEEFELMDDIDMYAGEINRLRREIVAIHDARRQWYKMDCPGAPPWEKTQKATQKPGG